MIISFLHTILQTFNTFSTHTNSTTSLGTCTCITTTSHYFVFPEKKKLKVITEYHVKKILLD